MSSHMVDPKIYKGIEYVRLSELPEKQRIKIKETLNEDLLIKILINGVLCHDCIQYKDYMYWFQNVYPSANDQSPLPAQDLSKVN